MRGVFATESQKRGKTGWTDFFKADQANPRDSGAQVQLWLKFGWELALDNVTINAEVQQQASANQSLDLR